MRKWLLAAAAAAGSVLLTAPAAGAMTYTLEPTDFDGVAGIVMNVTQQQLGGTLCPCTKIPYPADLLSNAQGTATLAATPLKAGDTVLGYSLGAVVASAYLNANTPPPGVDFILVGDPSNPNGPLAATGLLSLAGGGIPADTPDRVTIISRQYDGWADWPNNIFAPGYLLAVTNAIIGANTIHLDYTEASLLHNPANVTWRQGHITYVLVPTQNLPLNEIFRIIGLGFVADALDAAERPLIDAAYTNRPNPTAAQLAASTSEQAQIPPPLQIPGPPEPVVVTPTPVTTPTIPVLFGSPRGGFFALLDPTTLLADLSTFPQLSSVLNAGLPVGIPVLFGSPGQGTLINPLNALPNLPSGPGQSTTATNALPAVASSARGRSPSTPPQPVSPITESDTTPDAGPGRPWTPKHPDNTNLVPGNTTEAPPQRQPSEDTQFTDDNSGPRLNVSRPSSWAAPGGSRPGSSPTNGGPPSRVANPIRTAISHVTNSLNSALGGPPKPAAGGVSGKKK